MKELYLKLRELLQRAKKMGVTFSIKKFKIGTSLVYGGFLIKVDKEKGEISVLPDPKKIESMKNISPPTNRQELLSFLGLVKTFGKWSPHISFKTSHLKQLSTKGKVFNFDEVHLKEFLEIKAIISSPARLEPYVVGRRTELYTDGSRLKGLGYILTQVKEDNSRAIIQCGSTNLKKAQREYSTSELELLASVYAIKSCKYYLLKLLRL